MTIPLLFGPYGSSALEYIDQFESYACNAFWFHGFDPQVFEACEKYQIAACVEFKTFRADFSQHPELIPVGIDGKPIQYGELVQGVCLSQKDFLDEIESDLKAGLSQYQPTGVWLDYLTYGGWFETPTPDLQESCFCADCIAEFCNATGLDADTPQVILNRYQDEWTAHKCNRIAGLAKHYADIIHSLRPGTVVGAYMCPWMPQEFDCALSRIFGQDYVKMAPAIDIFTPLIYIKKSGRNSDWGQEFLNKVDSFIPQGKKVSLILDALDFPNNLLGLAETATPTWGFQMFSGAELFRDSTKAELFREAILKIREQVTIESN